jgi:hypothetical protein
MTKALPFALATLMATTARADNSTGEEHELAKKIAASRNCQSQNKKSAVDGSDTEITTCTFAYRGVELMLTIPTPHMSGGFTVLAVPNKEAAKRSKTGYVTLHFGSSAGSDSCYARIMEWGKPEKGKPKLAVAYIENRTGRVFPRGNQPDCAKP